jgi:tRNA pseudouridine55 synthase
MTKNKHPKNKLDGWINLNKPKGIGSTPALGCVKRALKPEKAGHGGTLDPLASGVLPIALGEATKTVAYAMDADKAYDFTVTWGETRTTDDAEGAVIATSDVRPSPDQIRAVLARFTGNIRQTPPVYSAIKVDGERAYDLARAGEDVTLKERNVLIYDLALTETGPDWARFAVTSGKGMYVRALARDIAKTLGTCGFVSELIRTRVGPFTLESAISLDFFRTEGVEPDPKAVLQPVQTVLDDIPALAVDEAEAARLRRGMTLGFMSRHNAERLPAGIQGPILAHLNGKAVAMVRFEAGEVKPERVFNLL